MNQRIRDLTLDAAKGNRAAAMWLCQVIEAMHLWDDLIDKDKSVADDHINHVFQLMLVEMPRNPFFQAHCANLTPLIVAAIQNWHIANSVERGNGDGVPLLCAYIIRSTYVDLIMMVATICGGDAHGIETGKLARALAHGEGFAQYQRNLADESAARDKE
jgi:hypothetical protein